MVGGNGIWSYSARQVEQAARGAGEGRKAQAGGCKPILRRGLLCLQEINGVDPFPLPGYTWPGDWGERRWSTLTEAGVVGKRLFQLLTIILQVATASAGTA